MNQLLTAINQEIFLVSSGLLILGFVFGRLAKIIKLPRVTGYVVAGIVLGPSVLKVFSENSVDQLSFIPQFALGVIALIIGAGLSFSLIRRLGIKLLSITLLESLGAFFAVSLLLTFFKMPLGAVLPLAAIAAATAPAATVAVMKEFRARGRFTETVLAVVALDDAIAITLFGLILTLDIKHLSNFGQAAIHSLSESFFEILLALIIGSVLAFVAHFLIKITKETTDTLIIILGIVLTAIGMASIFGVSALLTNMFLGMVLINISPKNRDIVVNLERMTPPIYCFFFVLAGAHLNLAAFTSVGHTMLVWGTVFVLARMLGKISGAYLGGTFSGAALKVRKYLGLALIPQAGVAIGLSLLIVKGSPYFEYRSIILNITLLSVAFNEIVGPVFTKYALFKAGDAVIEE
ncbi:MAG: cation:proton antiporter [Candidatus Saganbacteria bacterium]|nr:cation:proton antiporter [Candidatus Saganbacteria bacterium]